jgi:hypothetical protein
VAVSLIVKRKWLPLPAIVAAALFTSLLGAGTVLAYRRFLREADELRRKIEIEALALAFGVGVFGEATHFLLLASGAVSAHSSAYVLAGMVFTYSAAALVQRRRYS